MVKNLPANAGDIKDVGLIPGQEDPLEEGMAIHFSILAWRIPWTEEPGRLHTVESQSWTRLKQLSMHTYMCYIVQWNSSPLYICVKLNLRLFLKLFF